MYSLYKFMIAISDGKIIFFTKTPVRLYINPRPDLIMKISSFERIIHFST